MLVCTCVRAAGLAYSSKVILRRSAQKEFGIYEFAFNSNIPFHIHVLSHPTNPEKLLHIWYFAATIIAFK